MASSTPPMKKLKKNSDTTMADTENSILNSDRLSNLPTEILREIVCRLEVKDAVKTSVLSRKYENLWQEITSIKMFQRSFDKYNTLSGLFVAPKLSMFEMIFDLDKPTLVMPQEGFILSKWVGFLNSKHVEHLCIIKTHANSLRLSNFPHSIYKLTTLVSLTLPWPTYMTLPNDICLPSLKTLEHVIEQYRNWGTLSTLIKSCPRLEKLSLKILVAKDTRDEEWELICGNENVKTLHMLGSIVNVSSEKKIILTLEVPNLEGIVIHLNRRLQILWKTPTKNLKLKKIYKKPDEVFEKK